MSAVGRDGSTETFDESFQRRIARQTRPRYTGMKWEARRTRRVTRGDSMVLADTMAVFFIVVAVLLAFPSFWLMCCGLWPGTVERAHEASSKGMIKSLFIGIPITAIASIAVIALGKLNNPLINLLVLAILSGYLLFANIGMAGTATMIGNRLPSAADQDRQWRATLRGGIILVLAFLLPIVGWFFVLPLSIVIGSGIAARAVWPFGAKKQMQSAPPASADNSGPLTDATPS